MPRSWQAFVSKPTPVSLGCSAGSRSIPKGSLSESQRTEQLTKMNRIERPSLPAQLLISEPQMLPLARAPWADKAGGGCTQIRLVDPTSCACSSPARSNLVASPAKLLFGTYQTPVRLHRPRTCRMASNSVVIGGRSGNFRILLARVCELIGAGARWSVPFLGLRQQRLGIPSHSASSDSPARGLPSPVIQLAALPWSPFWDESRREPKNPRHRHLDSVRFRLDGIHWDSFFPLAWPEGSG